MTPASYHLASERGAALFAVLLASALVAAVAGALILQATTDARLAGSYRTGQEALYGAEAGLERVSAELAALPDWSPLLAAPPGNQTAPFTAAGPVLPTPDGRIVTVAQVVAALQASTPAGFGADTPQWRAYFQGPVARLWPGPLLAPPLALVVCVADDGGDGDGDAGRDSNGRVLVHVEAYGLQGARRQLEAVVERAGPGAVRRLAWTEVRR